MRFPDEAGGSRRAEADAELIEDDLVSFRDRAVRFGNVRGGGSVHRDVPSGDEFGDAADVVRVVMREQDRAQRKAVLRKVVFDDRGVAGIGR